STFARILFICSAPQILVEKINGTLPGKLGSGFIITWCRVVMEAMIRTLVNVRGVGYVIGLERRLVSQPSTGDTRVQRSVVKKQWRLDSGDILSTGLATVERNGSTQVR